MNDVAGPLVLITGAARGIGLACAERFLADGYFVAMCDIDIARVEAEAARLDASAERVRGFALDVSSATDVARCLAEIASWAGPVEVLVNVAGIVHRSPFLELEEADFDRVLDVNLKSVFLVSQAVARERVARKIQGSIINMSSINAVVAIGDQLAYAVSKGGINQMTRAMALSLAEFGIRVNAIGPGTIATDLARKTVLRDADARRSVLARTPLGRVGEVSEVAGIAAFLAGKDASYMTGQILYADGGRLILNYTVPVRD
jgi:NAD(P)-dependent dehydrogenase (short-subunit alcohol dehydrogenase family)